MQSVFLIPVSLVTYVRCPSGHERHVHHHLQLPHLQDGSRGPRQLLQEEVPWFGTSGTKKSVIWQYLNHLGFTFREVLDPSSWRQTSPPPCPEASRIRCLICVQLCSCSHYLVILYVAQVWGQGRVLLVPGVVPHTEEDKEEGVIIEQHHCTAIQGAPKLLVHTTTNFPTLPQSPWTSPVWLWPTARARIPWAGCRPPPPSPAGALSSIPPARGEGRRRGRRCGRSPCGRMHISYMFQKAFLTFSLCMDK